MYTFIKASSPTIRSILWLKHQATLDDTTLSRHLGTILDQEAAPWRTGKCHNVLLLGGIVEL